MTEEKSSESRSAEEIIDAIEDATAPPANPEFQAVEDEILDSMLGATEQAGGKSDSGSKADTPPDK